MAPPVGAPVIRLPFTIPSAPTNVAPYFLPEGLIYMSSADGSQYVINAPASIEFNIESGPGNSGTSSTTTTVTIITSDTSIDGEKSATPPPPPVEASKKDDTKHKKTNESKHMKELKTCIGLLKNVLEKL